MTWFRSALFNLWFYGVSVTMAVAGIVVRWFGFEFMLAYGRLWARLMLGGLRVICGVRWVVTGREYLPADAPVLVAAMHQSAFDVLVWILLVPRFAHVMKLELTRVPLFGPLARRSGIIPVDRGAGAAAMRGMLRDADRAVADRRQIIIFPEGTRAAPGARMPLQPGIAALAARTGLTVIPVATDSGLCWGRRAFRKQPGIIHVAIQPPIPPGLPRAALMQRLEAAFDAGAASLGHPRGGPSTEGSRD